MPGAGKGIVDVYDLAGTFLRKFVSNGVLNAPWGVVKASANFGAFSGDILIGNTGDGAINAFDSVTGALVGQLKDGNGNPIVNSDLHGMVFGDGSAGDRDALYITAGQSGASVFGAISDNTGGAAPDFTLTAAPSAATVQRGEALSCRDGTARRNFQGVVFVPLHVDACRGTSCIVGTTTVDAASGAASTSIAISASSTAQLTQIAAIGFPGILLTWFGLLSRNRRGHNRFTKFASGLLALSALALGLTGIIACGGSTPISTSTGTVPIVVTATTGSISHSTTLTLTVH